MSDWFISYQANQWLGQGQAGRQLNPKIKRIDNHMREAGPGQAGHVQGARE